MDVLESTVKAVSQRIRVRHKRKPHGYTKSPRTYTSFLTFSNGRKGLYRGRVTDKEGDKLVLATRPLADGDAPDIEILAYHNLTQDKQAPNLGNLVGSYAFGGLIALMGLAIMVSGFLPNESGRSSEGLLIGAAMLSFGIWLSLPTLRSHKARHKLNAYLNTKEH